MFNLFNYKLLLLKKNNSKIKQFIKKLFYLFSGRNPRKDERNSQSARTRIVIDLLVTPDLPKKYYIRICVNFGVAVAVRRP